MTRARTQVSADGQALCTGCAALFVLGNFMVAALLGGSGSEGMAILLSGVLAGALGAEAALHAIWSVFAPVAWPLRLSVALAVALLCYGALLLGVAGWAGPDVAGAVRFVFCLPLLLLGVQAPLWAARIWLRWRIAHVTDPSMGALGYGIRHLMAGTAAVALALAAVRWAAPAAGTDASFVISLAGAAVVAAFVSSLTTLPALVGALRAKRPLLWIAAMAGVTFAILVGVIVAAPVLFRPLGTVLPRLFLFFMFLVGAFYACLGGVLLVARQIGYRLVWSRGKNPKPAEPAAA